LQLYFFFKLNLSLETLIETRLIDYYLKKYIVRIFIQLMSNQFKN